MTVECTLAALLACFSWSGFYVDAGVAMQDTRMLEYRTTLVPGGRYDVANWYSSNPYGRAALGYELAFSKFALSLEASHVSSLTNGEDRGVNSLTLGVRWRPFTNR